ncbi:MAG TPA: hypothetical protein VFS53_03300 [Gemmatimonadota bacterium]|nr:hypothetical protein [Gemmatimonadota bacterium]
MSAPAGSRAPSAAAVIVLVAVLIPGCAAKRFLGFGGDATLLVRHHESEPQEIRLDGAVLGVADSGMVACFRDVRTGTLRLEARAPGNVLTRATSVVLPPDQARLWDIDHDQILEGRAFLRLCD